MFFIKKTFIWVKNAKNPIQPPLKTSSWSHTNVSSTISTADADASFHSIFTYVFVVVSHLRLHFHLAASVQRSRPETRLRLSWQMRGKIAHIITLARTIVVHVIKSQVPDRCPLLLSLPSNLIVPIDHLTLLVSIGWPHLTPCRWLATLNMLMGPMVPVHRRIESQSTLHDIWREPEFIGLSSLIAFHRKTGLT